MPKPDNLPVVVKPEPIDNTELVLGFRAEGGHIFHVRPRRRHDNSVTRGMTVAYKIKSGRIEMATSVQHRSDAFTKKIGTKTAIEHFRAEKTVCVPIRSAYPAEMLQQAMLILA